MHAEFHVLEVYFLKHTLQMFTGIYKVSVGKSESGDFKFMEIACITAILVIFDVNTLCGLLISTLNYDFFSNFITILARISRYQQSP